MNNQTVFSKVYTALVKQGQPSFHHKRGMCMYRTKKGNKILKCAVGHLIPRKEYLPKMEGKDIYSLRAEGILPKSLESVDTSLLEKLQNVHDSWGECTTYSFWKQSMACIAKDFGLKVPRVSRT
jgi:hypothetical protein